MRRNILLATAAIATLALVSGCNKPSNQSNNASSDTKQATSASGSSSSNNENGSRNASHHARLDRVNEGSSALLGAEAELSDIGFAANAEMGDMYVIFASRIARERSQSEAVKQFAQDMINASNQATSDLKGALPPSVSARLPVDLDAQHEKMIEELRNASDRDFNNRYLAQQREAHQDAVALFKDYARAGNEATLKKFAHDTLPTLKQHLARVASLNSHTQFASNTYQQPRKHK